MVWLSLTRSSLIFYLLDLSMRYFIYLSSERGEGTGERERETSMCERNINWLPFTCPQLGAWLTTQGCALTRIKLVSFWFAGQSLIH